MTVLDASAVLALLQDEPGADAVEDAIDDGALISAVNFAEVLSKMTDAGSTVDTAADLVASLFVEIVPFGVASARAVAHIRTKTPDAGLSLGDRACLALARSRTLRVLSADRGWRRATPALGIDLEVIR